MPWWGGLLLPRWAFGVHKQHVGCDKGERDGAAADVLTLEASRYSGHTASPALSTLSSQ